MVACPTGSIRLEAQDPKVFRGSITVEGSPIVEGSKVDPSGSLVTTVAEQQIDDLYAQDLTSALRRVPGVRAPCG